MFRKVDIEARVLKIAEAVSSGRSWEDTYVELKREIPKDHLKAARQIGGALNAGYPEPVIWVIGLDEKAGAITPQTEELHSWWGGVKKCFNELAPDFTDLKVPFRGEVLTVLWFSENRAPYVVEFQTKNGKQREIPWRQGSGAQNGGATRGQLVQLLAPLSKLPQVELTRVRVAQGVEFTMFVTPSSTDPIAFPTHQITAEVVLGNEKLATNQISQFSMARNQTAERGCRFTGDVIQVAGPGGITLHSGFPESVAKWAHSRLNVQSAELQFKLTLRVAGTPHQIVLTCDVPFKDGVWFFQAVDYLCL